MPIIETEFLERTKTLDVETLFFWFFNHSALMRRFRDLLADKMVELNTLLLPAFR